ncbi:MAG: chromosome partitioning protein ParA [Oscillospiraceae bacterium]|jgi:Mrp family chromosome partitioning ATPase|nr:chromosome partitioning protein ParA [Oscillospiraceae bacterium]
MKIKLALLDRDGSYLGRLTSAFTDRYSDRLELYAFTDAAAAIAALAISRINVFLATDTFDIDTDVLPSYCGFAYLVESPDIESYKASPAICKFQKVDSIFRAVLGLYSETVSEAIGIRTDSGANVRVIVFSSPAGGVGVSSSAAACARSFAANGKNVLYLNLEGFGGAAPFFSGEGQADFGDVIFALKSRKANLSLKLEGGVRRDASGVYFYAPPKTALDMTELGAEELGRLISELRLAGTYETVIVDMDFSFSSAAMEVIRQASEIVLVSDGSGLANYKLTRAYKAMELMERDKGDTLLPRLALFYNKFSNKTGQMLEDGIRTIGGAPKYERAETHQVVERLTGLGVFQKMH